jgi:hypothetical protein
MLFSIIMPRSRIVFSLFSISLLITSLT